MRRILALVLLGGLLTAGCGDTPDDSDGGPMDAALTDGSVADAGPIVLCAANSDCDDGLYCNGGETCSPGASEAGLDGCVPGGAPCDTAAGEVCDETGESCTMGGCEGADADLDGDGDDRIACGGGDCDDSNANVYGTAQEVCDADGLDEDCDPSTIHDDTVGSSDGDGDSDGYVSSECFNTLADGEENRGTDCDDTSADVHPDVTDGCGGGDADCDGVIDEDPDRTFYEDIDGDGFGVVASTLTACSAPDGYAVNDGDCDDANRNINPSRGEPCNGIDDDCSGVADDPTSGPACTCVDGREQRCGPTTDVGACTYGRSRCVSGSWGSCEGAVLPRAETCTVGDEDCDGLSDDLDGDIASGDPMVTGAFEWWRDMDRDGHGTSSDRVFACGRPVGYVAAGTVSDCMDGNGAIHPGATEACNGINDDCDMLTDEGCDCTDGATEICPTGSNVGECVRGNRTCSGGMWLPCDGVTATSEACNGLDDDCDGSDDEDFDCVRNETVVGNTMCGNAGSRMCTSSCAWAAPDFHAAESASTCDYCDDSGMGLGEELPFATLMTTGEVNGLWNLYGDAAFHVRAIPSLSYYSLVDMGGESGGAYAPDLLTVGYGPFYVNGEVQTTARTGATPCFPVYGSWSLALLPEGASTFVGPSRFPAETGVAAEWNFSTFAFGCSFSADRISFNVLSAGGSVAAGEADAPAGHQDGPADTTVSQRLSLLVTPDDPRTSAVDESAIDIVSPPGIAGGCANAGSGTPCGFVLRPGTRLHAGILAGTGQVSVVRPRITTTIYNTCVP